MSEQEKQDQAEKPVKLVHYTTAEAAYSILSNGELWMRKSSLMNDFSEILHGCSIFKKLTINKIRKCEDFLRTKELEDTERDQIKENLQKYKQLSNSLYKSLRRVRQQAYITSFSSISKEEQGIYLGRLSMWRAYGSKAGVAIIFKEDFCHDLQTLQTQLVRIKKVNYCHLTDADTDADKAFNLLTESDNIIPFIKHIGFEEETEWRLVVMDIKRKREEIPYKNKFQTIRGIPQRIYICNFDPIKCIDYIIIGPTFDRDHALAIRDAFSDLKYGEKQDLVFHDKTSIHLSDIPLRQY